MTTQALVNPLGTDRQLTEALPSATIRLTRDDALALLAAIEHSPLVVSRKVSFLKERLLSIASSDEWAHSILNKDEDRALRLWYLIRGCEHEMNTETWQAFRKELNHYCYGIDLENISRDKVMRFANQTVTVRALKAHKENVKVCTVKAKASSKKVSLDELEKILTKLKDR